MLFDLACLIVLILDIYVIYLILNGPGDTVKKLIWILVVIFLSPLGAILYLVLGRKA